MKLSKLRDDAFLYKDLTQWLRRRTFLPLFFGLLTAGEVVTVSMGVQTGSGAASGRDIYYGLFVILIVFATLVIIDGCWVASYEARHKLFEIHMLSGIRPEAVVRGKALTMMFQLLFGLICLVPFMLFALMYGNLGYLEVLLEIVALLCAFPLLVLWAIWTGFGMATLDSALLRLVSFMTQAFLLLTATLICVGIVTAIASVTGSRFYLPVIIGIVTYVGAIILLYGEARGFVPCCPSKKICPAHLPDGEDPILVTNGVLRKST